MALALWLANSCRNSRSRSRDLLAADRVVGDDAPRAGRCRVVSGATAKRPHAEPAADSRRRPGRSIVVGHVRPRRRSYIDRTRTLSRAPPAAPHAADDLVDGDVGLLERLVVAGHHLEQVGRLVGQVVPDARRLLGVARADGDLAAQRARLLVDQQQEGAVEAQPLPRGHGDEDGLQDLLEGQVGAVERLADLVEQRQLGQARGAHLVVVLALADVLDVEKQWRCASSGRRGALAGGQQRFGQEARADAPRPGSARRCTLRNCSCAPQSAPAARPVRAHSDRASAGRNQSAQISPSRPSGGSPSSAAAPALAAATRPSASTMQHRVPRRRGSRCAISACRARLQVISRHRPSFPVVPRRRRRRPPRVDRPRRPPPPGPSRTRVACRAPAARPRRRGRPTARSARRERAQQRVGARLVEDEAVAVGRGGVGHGVGQAAGAAHDRRRPVAQRVHLRQPAGLEQAGHQEQVAAGVDAVRERVVEAARRRRRAPAARPPAAAVRRSSAASPVPSTAKPKPSPARRSSSGSSRSRPFCATSRPTKPQHGPSASTVRPSSARRAARQRRAGRRARVENGAGRCGSGARIPGRVVDAVEDAAVGGAAAGEHALEAAAELGVAAPSRARRSG